MNFPPELRRILLDLAAETIARALEDRWPAEIDPSGYPEPLRRERACFVTLKIRGRLRGCIGSIEAYRPLVHDVVDNAYKAAFRDPRFPSLKADEFELASLSLSILTEPEALSVGSEEDLIRRLRPGFDGLIIEEGVRRGTFLPSVWEGIPDPRRFLMELKEKAGLPRDYWSDTLRFLRYTAETIEQGAPDDGAGE
jgi:AmmeMemoRadiSam system protein A